MTSVRPIASVSKGYNIKRVLWLINNLLTPQPRLMGPMEENIAETAWLRINWTKMNILGVRKFVYQLCLGGKH